MKNAVYSLTLSAAALILALHPMIASTYARVQDSMLCFFLPVFLMLALLALAAKYENSRFFLSSITTAAILTIGNAAALPLLRYTSSMDNMIAYAREIGFGTAITILTIPVTWVLVTAMIWLCRQSDRIQTITCIAAAALSAVCAAVIILCTDRGSHTTLIRLGNVSVQAAIPVLMLSLMEMALAVQLPGKHRKMLCISGTVMMHAALVIRHETAIPLIGIAGLILFYGLLQPYKPKWLTIALLSMIGSGVLIVGAAHCFHSSLPEGTLIYAISDKIETRIFAESVDQINASIRSLQTGGWLGSPAYNVYLSAASSDFSVVTILHYCGLAYLPVLLAAALPMFYTGAQYVTHAKQQIDITICGMSLSVLFVMFFYNLLMSVGLAPVMGSQMPFTGSSITYALLSGFLLGTMCYPKKTIKSVLVSWKGEV